MVIRPKTEVALTTRIVNRRLLLKTMGSAAAAVGFDGIAHPYVSRAAERPLITHGVQSGLIPGWSGRAPTGRRA